ncbi:MAG: DUF5343 domain-containing protein [Acidobacteriota bacterium]
MAESLPFVQASGNVTKALERIQSAATPPRFTADFLATKLDLKGGSARPLIPFLKRIGFLGSDGTPTELYKRFRNTSERGRAAAAALKTGFRPLYEVNEYIHDAKDNELKGIIVQVTGAEPNSSTVRAIIGSFKAVRAFASFDGDEKDSEDSDQEAGEGREERSEGGEEVVIRRLGLSYTINLNLPATSDIAVFDAIFRSLKEHLLK